MPNEVGCFQPVKPCCLLTRYSSSEEESETEERKLQPRMQRLCGQILTLPIPDDVRVQVRVVTGYGSDLRLAGYGDGLVENDLVEQSTFAKHDFYDGWRGAPLKVGEPHCTRRGTLASLKTPQV